VKVLYDIILFRSTVEQIAAVHSAMSNVNDVARTSLEFIVNGLHVTHSPTKANRLHLIIS